MMVFNLRGFLTSFTWLVNSVQGNWASDRQQHGNGATEMIAEYMKMSLLDTSNNKGVSIIWVSSESNKSSGRRGVAPIQAR